MSKIAKFLKDNIYIITFLGIITMPGIQLCTDFIKTDSSMEKRNKATLPDIGAYDDLSSYFKDYETYFNDNFGFRSELIALNSKIDLNIFNQSANDDVILGRDGYLFYGDEMPDYHKTNVLTDYEIDLIAKKLFDVQKNLKEFKNIEFIFNIAPNKSTIYPEYIKENSLNPNISSNLDRLQERLDFYQVNYLDLKKVMLENKNKHQLYYLKDTHWNTTASIIAGNEYLKFLNSKFDTNHSIEITDTKLGFYDGDLDNLLGFYSNTPEYISNFKLNINGDKLPKALSYADSFGNTVLPLITPAFNQNLSMHLQQAPFLSNFPIFSENASIVTFQIVERNIDDLLNYDFSIFDESNNEIHSLYNSKEINLNKNENQSISLHETAYWNLDESNLFSSNTNKSYINIEQTFDLDYLYLEMENVPSYTTISFYWRDDNNDFSEENKIDLLLVPDKNKYLLDLNQLNAKGNNLKIKISNSDNISLNIKSLTAYNSFDKK